MKDETNTPTPPALYFGTDGRAGHFFFQAPGFRAPTGEGVHGTAPWSPWAGEFIDGKLVKGLGPEGVGKVRHRGGWTWIAWTDHSGDDRPGSNANYLLPGEWSFDIAVERARLHFPRLFRRYEYPIREESA